MRTKENLTKLGSGHTEYRTEYDPSLLEAFDNLHPENDYYLIMGEDTFRTFARWKNAELIAKLCHIVIGSRNRDGEKETRDLSIRYRQMFGGDYIRVWFPVAEVSSSEIRKRIAEGRKADHLLPHGVMEYIKVNRLYAGKISMPSARSMMFYGLQGERL